MIKEAFQDLNRLRQIAVIAARHGFADYLERLEIGRMLGFSPKAELSEEAKRATTARRFRMLLNDLGPTYVKLGQVLSTRADLLPAEYIDELSTLQDDVPPIPLEEVHRQIETSLGRPVLELFRSIDPQPLAAASIAQVHRAVTLEGEEVVVKVQRPGILERFRADLSVLHSLARALEAVVEETGIYTPTGIVEEFDRAIHEELDFLHEAANIRAFFRTHKERPKTKIPKVFDALSSRHVLTLEYIRGVKICAAQLAAEDRAILARQILDEAFQQLFEDGLFHADPHPGNMLLQEDHVIALLDFGLVGRVTHQMKETLVMLVLSIALRDSESVARILYRLGEPDSRANLAGFKADIDTALGQYLPAKLGDINAKNLLRDLLDLAVKYRIKVPKEYAILSRASIATEGILRSLHPEMNIGEVALPYAKRLLADRYDPNQLQGGMLRTLLRVQTLANELPTQLSQVMLDLESGKFSVNVRAEQLDKMNTNLRALAIIGFLGLCACGFIVGTFIAFSQTPWMAGGVPVLGVIGIAMATGLFGAAATWYLFAGRMRKLQLRKLLKRF